MKITKIDNTIEEKIITGLIVSDRFCKEIIPTIKKEYFKISYCQKVAMWVKEYFKKYKKAPNKHIKDIYEIKKDKLKEADSELIETFLINLSSKYTEENIKYLLHTENQNFTISCLLF